MVSSGAGDVAVGLPPIACIPFCCLIQGILDSERHHYGQGVFCESCEHMGPRLLGLLLSLDALNVLQLLK